MTIQRIEAGPRMSKVVVHGDTVYLAGLTANKTVGQSLAEQSAEILSQAGGYFEANARIPLQVRLAKNGNPSLSEDPAGRGPPGTRRTCVAVRVSTAGLRDIP